jgi:hypothetical protein
MAFSLDKAERTGAVWNGFVWMHSLPDISSPLVGEDAGGAAFWGRFGVPLLRREEGKAEGADRWMHHTYPCEAKGREQNNGLPGLVSVSEGLR